MARAVTSGLSGGSQVLLLMQVSRGSAPDERQVLKCLEGRFVLSG